MRVFQLTAADLQFLASIECVTLLFKQKDLLKKFPSLQALHDRVSAQPAIAAYLKKRPDTMF